MNNRCFLNADVTNFRVLGYLLDWLTGKSLSGRDENLPLPLTFPIIEMYDTDYGMTLDE